MLNMNQFTQEIKDNTVVINGAEFKVTDSVALKIMALIKGDTPSSNTVSKPVVKTSTNQSTKGLHNVEYHIVKHDKVWCISRGTPYTTKNGRTALKNGGWTSSEKRCINNAIKGLDGIKTVQVPMENGKSYSAWGFSTKKAAEAALKTLPTSFTAEEISKFDRTR